MGPEYASARPGRKGGKGLRLSGTYLSLKGDIESDTVLYCCIGLDTVLVLALRDLELVDWHQVGTLVHEFGAGTFYRAPCHPGLKPL